MFEKLKSIIREVFDLSMDTAQPDVIYERVIGGTRVKGTNAVLLILSIFIASAGLNSNSVAVIIGAMLISPLMGGITAAGYGAGTNNYKMTRNALVKVAFQVVVAIIISTLYFRFSLITTTIPTEQLLARSEPTLTDVLIAVCGGLAGILALTREDSGTVVIPGVAIATAIMPPLCTVGYGLATAQWHVSLMAFYLFFINAFCIGGSATIMVRLLKLPTVKGLTPEQHRKVTRNFIILAIIIFIPAAIMSFSVYMEHVEEGNANTMYSANDSSSIKMDTGNGIQKSIDEKSHIKVLNYFSNSFISYEYNNLISASLV